MIIGKYKNGNYKVAIMSDGTKIRAIEDGVIPNPCFPENMDVKITNYCNVGCSFCYEDSTLSGKHGDILNLDFIKSLKPFTEMAIGGGDPMSHPQLKEFLIELKEQKVIANITVNQKTFENEYFQIKELINKGLIYGVGISLVNPSYDFINLVKTIPNAVVHVINGLVTKEQLSNLSNHNLKILVLGYKSKGRGYKFIVEENEFISKNQHYLKTNLTKIAKKFSVFSFDNLGIEQLDALALIPKEEIPKYYMGDDGKFTMYVDLVKKEYAKNSISEERYSLSDLSTVEEIFAKIKES